MKTIRSVLYVRCGKALDFSQCNSRPGTGSLHLVAAATSGFDLKRGAL